jgi:molecular chaperone GrpE
MRKRRRSVTNDDQKLNIEELEKLVEEASDQIDEFDPFEELAKAQSERDSYLDQLQRSVAEFANYRRRVEQEREQAREHASRGLLSQIVPVLDDFERAIVAMPEEEHASPWMQGIVNIQRKLSSVLERNGVEMIDALWQPFDPALHEAVATDPGSAGTYVVEVYQNGYRLGSSLLRPAMVKVGDPPAA